MYIISFNELTEFFRKDTTGFMLIAAHGINIPGALPPNFSLVRTLYTGIRHQYVNCFIRKLGESSLVLLRITAAIG